MSKSLEDFKIGDKVKVIAQIGGTHGLKDPTGLTGVVDNIDPEWGWPVGVTLDFSELEAETGERVYGGEYPDLFLVEELDLIHE